MLTNLNQILNLIININDEIKDLEKKSHLFKFNMALGDTKITYNCSNN